MSVEILQKFVFFFCLSSAFCWCLWPWVIVLGDNYYSWPCCELTWICNWPRCTNHCCYGRWYFNEITRTHFFEEDNEKDTYLSCMVYVRFFFWLNEYQGEHYSTTYLWRIWKITMAITLLVIIVPMCPCSLLSLSMCSQIIDFYYLFQLNNTCCIDLQVPLVNLLGLSWFWSENTEQNYTKNSYYVNVIKMAWDLWWSCIYIYFILPMKPKYVWLNNKMPCKSGMSKFTNLIHNHHTRITRFNAHYRFELIIEA